MTRKAIEFGFLLPTRGLLLENPQAPNVSELWDLAAAVEELGFQHLWIGDSVTAKPRMECLTTLGALAAKTRRVKLGTSVLLPALRNPVLLAQATANLDVLSGGRIILGMGVARRTTLIDREFRACGVPVEQKAGRMNEVVKILRMLWREEKVAYSGKYYSFEEIGVLPKPMQKPGIPILMASNNVDGGLRRVAALGDAWMTNAITSEIFKICRDKLIAFAAAIGRDGEAIEPTFYASFHLHERGEVAREEGWQYMENYYYQPRDLIATQQVTIFGTPDECAKVLQEYIDLGVKRVIVRFAAKDQFAQLKLCMRELMPRFAG